MSDEAGRPEVCQPGVLGEGEGQSSGQSTSGDWEPPLARRASGYTHITNTIPGSATAAINTYNCNTMNIIIATII
tara:strand:+ start:63 stop:287 length:225 start_codon:yes stop_codon:yes gene_type:complete